MGLIGNEETLRRSQFRFPAPTSKPIDALAPAKTNGLQCQEGTCRYICANIQQRYKHRKKDHGIIATGKGGRFRKGTKKPMLETLCKAFDWMIWEAQIMTTSQMVSQAAFA
jgi:hypothetical protein